MMQLLWHIFRWFCGGVFFCAILLLLVGDCHWTDLIVCSALCIPLDIINELMPWTIPLLLQAIIGGHILAVSQLVLGLILNVWLSLGLWDCSGFSCNLWGQISPTAILLHLLLAGPLLILFDMIGFRAGGPWPHYKFF